MSALREETLSIAMLNGEQILLVLNPKLGLEQEIPPGGAYIALTNDRIIGTWQEDSRQRNIAIKTPSVDSLELIKLKREPRPLFTGGFFVLAGLGVPWFAMALDLSGLLSYAIAILLVVLGFLTASAYFVREQVALLSIRGGNWEFAVPLATNQAVAGGFSFINSYFALSTPQPEINSPTPTWGETNELEEPVEQLDESCSPADPNPNESTQP